MYIIATEFLVAQLKIYHPNHAEEASKIGAVNVRFIHSVNDIEAGASQEAHGELSGTSLSSWSVVANTHVKYIYYSL